MKRQVAVILLFLGLALPARGQSPIKEYVSFPSLAKKSHKEAEKLLGKPSRVTKITRYPDQMPGEFREWNLKNGASVLLRFKEDVCVSLTAQFDSSDFYIPEVATRAVGIDVQGISPSRKNDFVISYSGELSGVKWKTVSVQRSGQNAPFTMISAQPE